MYNLIDLVLKILIIGAFVHWLLEFIARTSYNETVIRIKSALDRVYLPMLEVIRNYVKPLTLSDGRAIDFSHLILIVVLAVFRRIAFWLF